MQLICKAMYIPYATNGWGIGGVNFLLTFF